MSDSDIKVRSYEQMQSQLLARAADDMGFRQRLITNPHAAIHEELQVEIPEHLDIQVHESDVSTVPLSLPPSRQLSEEQLEQAAGSYGTVG